MNDLERGAVYEALRKMFRPSGYLDICTIKQVLEVTKIVPPERELNAVHLLHCVHWTEMDPATRDAATQTILGWFEILSFDPLGELEATPETAQLARSGFFRRLFGRVS